MPASVTVHPPAVFAPAILVNKLQSRLPGLVAAVFLLPVIALPGGCATNPVSGQQELVMMSEAEEIEIGRQLSKIFPKRFGGAYESPETSAYINSVGEKIAAVVHRKNLIYHFTVLDSPAINAFALPGGYVYITRGMLAHLRSEGELAAVLAHELGHITARHAVSRHAKAFLLSLLGTIALQSTDAAGSTTWNQVASVVNQAILSGYSRADEHQADQLGAEYLAKTGYRTERMLEVLNVLQSMEEYERNLAKKENRQPQIYHGIFSTHPENKARLENVVEASKGLAAAPLIDDRRGPFLKRLEGLVYGGSAKGGIVRGSSFYHAKLGIALDFPQGWTVKNHPDRLDAYTAGDTAAIRLTVRDRNRKESETRYLRRALKNRDLEQISPLQGEFGGYTAYATLPTKYGRKRARVGVIFKNKQAYEFTAAGKTDADFNKHNADFVATMETFRGLESRRDRELAQPRRIKLVRVESGETVASIISRLSLEAEIEDAIRLLNGLYPEREPQAGDLLKVPV